MPLLVTDTQICVVRKIKACALTFSPVEKFSEFCNQQSQSLIGLKRDILEWREIDLFDFKDFHIVAHSTYMRGPFGFDCDQKVVPHNVDNTQNASTVKSPLFKLIRFRLYKKHMLKHRAWKWLIVTYL